MTIAKLKIIKKKPFVYTDRSWLPYREIIDTETFDDMLCQEIDCDIEQHGIRNVVVYYSITEKDYKNRPTKILVGYKVKKTKDGMDFFFNTKYDNKPLTFKFTTSGEPMTADEPFYYRRFLAEEYID